MVVGETGGGIAGKETAIQSALKSINCNVTIDTGATGGRNDHWPELGNHFGKNFLVKRRGMPWNEFPTDSLKEGGMLIGTVREAT